MRTNSFKCAKCGEYTRHIEISLREAASIDIGSVTTTVDKVGKTIAQVVTGALDLFGVGVLNSNIVGIVPYKCCKCGRCAWRDSNGEEKEYMGCSK